MTNWGWMGGLGVTTFIQIHSGQLKNSEKVIPQDCYTLKGLELAVWFVYVVMRRIYHHHISPPSDWFFASQSGEYYSCNGDNMPLQNSTKLEELTRFRVVYYPRFYPVG